MSREVSVRELRNHTSDVVAAVRSGQRVCLTVNQMPVADIVPHRNDPEPWISSETLRAIVEESGADGALLDDLADVRGGLVDEP